VHAIEGLAGDEALEGLDPELNSRNASERLWDRPRDLSRDRCRSAVYSGP
jgi:hypothetical protein